jgi:hypothetical protein
MGLVARHKDRELRVSPHGFSRYHDLFAEVATCYDGAKDKHSQGARRRRLRQLRWWPLPELPTASPRGPPSMSSSTTMVAAVGAPDSTPRGPAIDVFINYDGGRCRSSRQHPQGPAIDVFINYDGGRCRSSRQHPQGVRHRRLHQLRWWPLPELLTAPPGGQQSMCG